MVVPHRTPWVSLESFQQTYNQLIAPDLDAHFLALQSLKVWLERGQCPHYVESIANLLAVNLRDQSASSSSLELRLSYSMSLIRFVNSLLDPLQTTYYARSLSSLATQIGLPLYFVELRHEGTHEDLSSLEVLREGSRQAIEYLLKNFWEPILLPTSSSSSILRTTSLNTLRTLLKSYKQLKKSTLRDTSKSAASKTALEKIYLGILGEELEYVVEVLCEEGGMIPLSKKKRPNLRSPSLNIELVELWTPLLLRLEDTHESFFETLLEKLVEFLLPQSGTSDSSFILTVQAWILHLLGSIESDEDYKEPIIKKCLLNPCPSTLSLLDSLAKDDEGLKKRIKPLIGVMRNVDNGLENTMKVEDSESKLSEMELRMKDLDKLLKAKKTKSSPANSIVVEKTTIPSSASPWPLAPSSQWQPCPFGMLPGNKLSVLDLSPPTATM